MKYVESYYFNLRKKDFDNLIKIIEILSKNKISATKAQILRASIEAFKVGLQEKNWNLLELLEGK